MIKKILLCFMLVAFVFTIGLIPVNQSYAWGLPISTYIDFNTNTPCPVKIGYKFNDPTTTAVLRIKDKNNVLNNKNEKILLHLENAKWLTDDDFENSTFNKEMESYLKKYASYVSPTDFSIERLSDSTIQVTIYNAVNSQAKNLLKLNIPMFVEILDKGRVKVTIDSPVKKTTLLINIGVDEYTYATIESIKAFENDEVLTLPNIQIEESHMKVLPIASGKISFKLPNGFKWIKAGTIKGIKALQGATGIATIDGQTLEITMDYSKAAFKENGALFRHDIGKIILEGTTITATSKANVGDVKIKINVETSNDEIDDKEIKIAVYNKSDSEE